MKRVVLAGPRKGLALKWKALLFSLHPEPYTLQDPGSVLDKRVVCQAASARITSPTAEKSDFTTSLFESDFTKSL